MEIYGLVGKSGTGKSYQALSICRDRDIPCLIDDGLFIGKNRVYGGISAKKAGTMVGAIKTALFTEEAHKNEVMEAIKRRNPESILILGTSDRMIYRIAKRLELPEPIELIKIEEVTSPEEREIARTQRDLSGKHAIPVATFQLRREFSGYFISPLKIFKHVGTKKTVVAEKSEVRPTFSYLGKYTISERVFYDIIKYSLADKKSISKLIKCDLIKQDLGLEIYIDVILKYGVRVKNTGEEVQKLVKANLETLTGFNIMSVNLTVKGLE